MGFPEAALKNSKCSKAREEWQSNPGRKTGVYKGPGWEGHVSPSGRSSVLSRREEGGGCLCEVRTEIEIGSRSHVPLVCPYIIGLLLAYTCDCPRFSLGMLSYMGSDYG